jgi:hypothetical protein
MVRDFVGMIALMKDNLRGGCNLAALQVVLEISEQDERPIVAASITRAMMVFYRHHLLRIYSGRMMLIA